MRKSNIRYFIVFFNFLCAVFCPVISYGNIYEFEVKQGDTLSNIIREVGISSTDAANAISAMQDIYNPGKIRVGDKIKISYSTLKAEGETNKVLVGIDFFPSKLEKVYVRRAGEDSFYAKKVEVPTAKRLVKASAQIESTFFGATKKSGIPFEIGNEFVKKYSYDVDFQRDLRKGNTLDVLYEEVVTPTGDVVGSGEILYANLELNEQSYPIYRFRTLDGSYGYYNEDGESIEKSFLRTPIDGARITSGFGKRRHPILGYNKMHKGLDFGAPQGTPIYAAGSGVVTKIGKNGSYGNYIQIGHGNGYSTAYAHLKGFKRGLKKGGNVKQGQIIGYVGTTGRSTGPHLHYEVLKHDRQINPLSIKTVAVNKLEGVQMGIYSQHVKMVKREVSKVDARNKVAVLEIN
ncbi:MAG: peptidoglycan DD-metalloendopeptidase family protein [Rickettsiales bacterium]|nr:peptidoglycan DD-metalloendopeptidase family protein [Pseudomonadota bacterium]MDA0966902.1 peptidoglycan DD-metalloendopeptidase family protein [Pseudomonadota bacterium]MDG4544455.1 peptidoglycan DD-metalloendopeptidase family protein [Rickettsiales bacterium]MDG4546606.1 peptidoglycan DD-metalloendopeptidase family protein [Rickettsiales bacterium]MDG4548731.1 peptidoglycan DD-metalloendopeptidase family protein [Rickettsiales bacterium]